MFPKSILTANIFESGPILLLNIEFQRVFGQFSISSKSEKGHEPSRAENPSARAMAGTSLTQTHH